MSIDPIHIKTLKVAKYKTLNDTLFYTRYFFKKRFNRKFVVGDHHQTICAALDRVYRGECKRLIINLAPRYGKTEIAVKNFISKGLAINPAAKFIHLTYADDLALDNSEEIKDLVTSAEYQELFPQVQLKKDAKAKNKWYTTAGGGVYARAAGGQVTGFGAGAVDLEEETDDTDDTELTAWASIIGEQAGFGGAIVIDDPIKPEDANSDVIRERVNNRFDSTIRNRVNSRNTPIVVIGQRVHPNDLSGYLMEVEPGEWEVISLPCLTFTEGQPKALWPFKHTVEELLKLKRINEHVFDTQYQQDAEQKAGLLFPKAELHYYDHSKTENIKPEFVFIPVDPADGGGDYYSAPKCLIAGDKVFIPKVIFNKRDTDENIPDTANMAIEGKAHAVQVESNGGWKLARKSLKLLIQDKLPDCTARSINARTNKETRILAAAAWIRNHCYFREDWETCDDTEYRDFMKNLTGYMREGKNKNDDAPDVLAQLYEYCEKNLGI